MHTVILKVKIHDAPDFLFTEKRSEEESYLEYRDILQHMAEKLGTDFEKLSISDSGTHFTDECPEHNFSFKVKDAGKDEEYLVQVEGNRKERNKNAQGGSRGRGNWHSGKVSK